MKIRPMMQNRISSYVKNDLVNRNLTGFAEVQFGTQKQNSLVEAACGCGNASLNVSDNSLSVQMNPTHIPPIMSGSYNDVSVKMAD